MARAKKKCLQTTRQIWLFWCRPIKEENTSSIFPTNKKWELSVFNAGIKTYDCHIPDITIKSHFKSQYEDNSVFFSKFGYYTNICFKNTQQSVLTDAIMKGPMMLKKNTGF